MGFFFTVVVVVVVGFAIKDEWYTSSFLPLKSQRFIKSVCILFVLKGRRESI